MMSKLILSQSLCSILSLKCFQFLCLRPYRKTRVHQCFGPVGTQIPSNLIGQQSIWCAAW